VKFIAETLRASSGRVNQDKARVTMGRRHHASR
jgi:hypothetical protein